MMCRHDRLTRSLAEHDRAIRAEADSLVLDLARLTGMSESAVRVRHGLCVAEPAQGVVRA